MKSCQQQCEIAVKSCRAQESRINDRNIIETCDIFPCHVIKVLHVSLTHPLGCVPLTNSSSKQNPFLFSFCYLHKRRNQVLWQFQQLREHKRRQASNDIHIHTYVSAPACVGVLLSVCVRVQEVSVSVSACCFVTKQKLSHKYFPSFWLEIYQRYPPWATHAHTEEHRQSCYTNTYIYINDISMPAHASFVLDIFMKCGNLSPVGGWQRAQCC